MLKMSLADAIDNNDIILFKELIKDKKNLEYVHNSTMSPYHITKPLHYAKTAEQTKLLIDAGSDLHAKDIHGKTPLHYAKTAGQTKLLIEASKFSKSSKAGFENGNIFKHLDAQKYCEYINARDCDEDTPLHCARTIEQTKLLIEAGADVNAKNFNGRTPLHFAKNVEHLKALLENGSDPNIKDNIGILPIQMRQMTEPMKQLLIQYGSKNY